MIRNYNHLIFEQSQKGRRGYSLPQLDVEEKDPQELIGSAYLRQEVADLPEVSEVEVLRHYTNLSHKNYGVDTGFYPLGSCTMKYNPKINEELVRLPGFLHFHPLTPESHIQGSLQLMYEMQEMLAEIAGMDAITLQPAAGAQGELTGIMMIKAYHEKNGDTKRKKIIVPDAAHGTNPATASMVGFKPVEIPSNEHGLVDIEALEAVLGDDIAGLMLTNPNTLGLFEEHILEISEKVHAAGGLLYYDGANANAILGKSRPGDMGFDIVHFNIHKTFSTPHGGGGPGSGPVGVKAFLKEFLPVPTVNQNDDGYYLDYDHEDSIGKVKDFYGHFGILVRAYTYILTMGADGLKMASEMAVLNANYLLSQLKDHYQPAYDEAHFHEFVLAGLKDQPLRSSTLHVAKRLMDYGFHPMTIYFPLIVHEAMMIEPTETESKQSLDAFAKAMRTIAQEVKENKALVDEAPHNTPICQPDEALAARKPILIYQEPQE